MLLKDKVAVIYGDLLQTRRGRPARRALRLHPVCAGLEHGRIRTSVTSARRATVGLSGERSGRAQDVQGSDPSALGSAVATTGGDRALSPRRYSPGYNPLKAETRSPHHTRRGGDMNERVFV
jgi:hypothetical protein